MGSVHDDAMMWPDGGPDDGVAFPSTGAQPGGCILVVDDSGAIRRLVARALRRRGFTVHEACDGEEALAAITRQVPDVVISDMDMPRLDGLGLLKRLKTDRPGLPVIVLTGHGSMQNVLAAMRDGSLFDYLLKPLPDFALLEIAVQRALEVSRLRERAREADQVEAMRELAVTAADRIRNPLHVISLSLESLRRHEPESQHVAEAAKRIVHAAQRINAALEQMAQISRYTPVEVVKGLRMIDLKQAASDGPEAEEPAGAP